MDAALVLAQVGQPPEDVQQDWYTLMAWALWLIVALGAGRLLFIGAKWGWSKHFGEGFNHSGTEIALVLIGTILASTAQAWVLAMRWGG